MANSIMLPSPGIDFTNLNAEKKYSPSIVYGQSKLSNVLHAKELQRRFDAEGIDVTVVSLHPGVINTKIYRHTSASMTLDMLGSTRYSTMPLKLLVSRKDIPVGVSTNVYCAVSPDIVKGEYYNDNAINTDLLHEQANNKEMAKKLWEVSEQLLAEKDNSKI